MKLKKKVLKSGLVIQKIWNRLMYIAKKKCFGEDISAQIIRIKKIVAKLVEYLTCNERAF